MSRKHYSKLNLFIRSFIFSVYSVLAIFIYSAIFLFAVVLPLKKRHFIIRCFLRSYFFMLEKICHLKYKVTGLENIKHLTHGVVLSKHSSVWETFFLPLIFHETAFVAKRELLWIPFFGWAFALSKPITINRKKRSSAMQQIITKGRKCLNHGRWVVVFPEGTRIPWGTVGTYRLGGARLAVETHAAAIPVAHNAGKFWPKRSFIKTPGTITVVIGAPISTAERTPDAVMSQAKEWIETAISQIA